MVQIKLINRFALPVFFVLIILVFGCKKTGSEIKNGFDDILNKNPSITIDTNVKNVDVSKYARARVFPGLVCASEPRITTTLNMNLNYNYVGPDLRISVPPQPQFSTGLYAAPGELVIVDLPPGDYSLALQIGAWTDNLSSVSNPPRDPVIYTKMQLAPGRNYVRNLYGGPIYINPAKPVESPLAIKFTNVVKSPDFVLGETSNADWQAAIRASCVPYIEIRSRSAAFVVPRQYCIDYPIADPTVLMQQWEDIIAKDFYGWMGLIENPADPIDRSPLLAYRFVQDIKPVVGYGHAGFPIVTFDDFEWFNGFTNAKIPQTGAGGWGTWHELGHNMQQGTYWSWGSLGETTNNLFIFKTANRMLKAGYTAAWPPKHPAVTSMVPKAMAFAAEANSAKNFDGTDSRISDPFARLTPFLQIFDKAVPDASTMSWATDGWDFMAYLYKRARRANRISYNDQDKRDFVYEALCEFTKRDWQVFFRSWGISISNISLDKMSVYPIMNQKVWEYNPITRTGGTGIFIPDPYNKSSWRINSFSSQHLPNNVATNIIDGNKNTIWHNNWPDKIKPPHWIIIDFANIYKVDNSIPVKGFVFTQRQTNPGVRIKNITVETSMDLKTWTAVPGSPFALSTEDLNPQTKTLSTVINARYIRLTIPTSADINASDDVALAEFDVVKP